MSQRIPGGHDDLSQLPNAAGDQLSGTCASCAPLPETYTFMVDSLEPCSHVELQRIFKKESSRIYSSGCSMCVLLRWGGGGGLHVAMSANITKYYRVKGQGHDGDKSSIDPERRLFPTSSIVRQIFNNAASVYTLF